MLKELVCITCPMSCHLEVELDNDSNVIKVLGNSCKRGESYAINELTNPVRVLTSIVKINNGIHKVLPVISDQPIPKHLIFEVMNEINKITLNAPVKMGEIIISNVLNTGINIVASRTMNKVD